MSQIVLVHGIGQSQRGVQTLAAEWGPAVADGVSRAGHEDLARSIWPPTKPDRMAMAFYGDLFVTPGAQGSKLVETGPGGEDLEAELASALLAAASQRAKDPRDMSEATQYLGAGSHTGKVQGVPALARPPLQALASIRWMAVGGLAFASTFLNHALREVSAYITRDDIRDAAQQRVLRLIDSDTRVVIAHSLGTVVAYEALHRTQQPIALITLGSPLGLRNVIYDRLRPSPPSVPDSVTVWNDFSDIDDLVAADTDLAPLFAPSRRSAIRPVSDISSDNGSKPHDATHYLVKAPIGAVVARSLTPTESRTQ
jgi:hypothetical protein